MRYSQKILQQRLSEVQELIPNFNVHSADYIKLRRIELDLILACNQLSSMGGPIIKHKTMRFESLMISGIIPEKG